MMTAGLFGTEIDADAKGRKNTVRPVSGWWMFEKVAEGEEKKDSRQEILAGVTQDHRCKSSNASEQEVEEMVVV